MFERSSPSQDEEGDREAVEGESHTLDLLRFPV
jgi:hypothetical protein